MELRSTQVAGKSESNRKAGGFRKMHEKEVPGLSAGVLHRRVRCGRGKERTNKQEQNGKKANQTKASQCFSRLKKRISIIWKCRKKTRFRANLRFRSISSHAKREDPGKEESKQTSFRSSSIISIHFRKWAMLVSNESNMVVETAPAETRSSASLTAFFR